MTFTPHDCTRRKSQVDAHGRTGLIDCRVSPVATVVLQALDEFRRHGEVQLPFRVVFDRRVRSVAWPLLFEAAAIQVCEGYVPAVHERPQGEGA